MGAAEPACDPVGPSGATSSRVAAAAGENRIRELATEAYAIHLDILRADQPPATCQHDGAHLL